MKHTESTSKVLIIAISGIFLVSMFLLSVHMEDVRQARVSVVQK